MPPLVDRFGRRVTYLRVSLTDRCNLRCFYCRPRDFRWREKSEILTLEEVARLVDVAASLGIHKVRLTGGEPLLRPGATDLVRRLARIPGIEDLALSTNGTLLADLARPLRDAGLARVNVSLDTLRPEVFREITGGSSLAQVLAGIEVAAAVGLRPVKLNVVVVRGVNEDELDDLLAFGRRVGAEVRFIEYMPMTGDPMWASRHVPAEEILRRIASWLVPADVPIVRRDAAAYYELRDGGVVGVVSPVSCRFCSLCNRLRLTADGRLRPCLTGDGEVDLRSPVRAGESDATIALLFGKATAAKPPSGTYETAAPRRPMVAIGG
jgi:cyclic pyranopterin phosphate synthase